jgi:hypothetical protein
MARYKPYNLKQDKWVPLSTRVRSHRATARSEIGTPINATVAGRRDCKSCSDAFCRCRRARMTPRGGFLLALHLPAPLGVEPWRGALCGACMKCA